MKKQIVFFVLLMTGFLCRAQFDSFSTTIHSDDLGDLNVVLYKYNIRGDNFQVFTYDGTDLTPYTPKQVRSYRGYVTNMENSKISAVWFPDDRLYIKSFNGKGEKYGFEVQNLKIENLDIIELNLPTIDAPQSVNSKITSGYTTNFEWMNNKNRGGDIDYAIAIFENAVCQYDISISRDIGVSMELNLIVLPIADTVELFDPKNNDYPGLNVTKSFWKTYGSGGGAGRKKYCENDYSGGRTSLSEKGFGALPHEFGHTMDLGHYHNQEDAQHSNMFFLGRENAIRAKTFFDVNNPCLATESNYTDPLHPYTPEDYFITDINVVDTLDVLKNDIDYNGDIITIKDFDSTSISGGTITQVGQVLVYTPAVDFVGRDYFYYRAQSGSVDDNSYYYNKGKVFVDVRAKEGLALYLDFEETTGTAIHDNGWGIQQHEGTSMIPMEEASVVGKLGQGIHIQEEGGIALLDILDPLDGSLSIDLWFKLDEIPVDDNKGSFMLFDSGSRGTLNNCGLSMVIRPDEIHFYAQQEGVDNSGVDRFKKVDWEVGKWYRATMVLDYEKGKLFGYLDDEELGNSEIAQVIKNNAVFKGYPGGISDRFATTIGMRGTEKPSSPQMIFKGAIDEFKIYTEAIVPGSVTSVDIKEEVGHLIFPNPFSGNLSLELDETYAKVNIELLNLLGQTVYSKSFFNTEKINIITKDIKAGNYLVKVNLDGKTFSEYIIKL